MAADTTRRRTRESGPDLAGALAALVLALVRAGARPPARQAQAHADRGEAQGGAPLAARGKAAESGAKRRRGGGAS
jgi:hypothetical protein